MTGKIPEEMCLGGRVGGGDGESGFGDPVAGAGPEGGGAVARVGEAALVEREAAATDAVHESAAEAFELGDLLVDAGGPAGGELGPVGAFGGVVAGELVEFFGDFVEGETDALGEDDEGDATEDGAREAAMPGACALGADEASILIEAERGGGDAGAAGDLGDGEEIGHEGKLTRERVDFKLT